MKTWRLCVPTYKRKEPLILQMLDKDPYLEIYLCCRHEEIESGFYDELSKKDRVHIVDLGSNIVDIGDTRQRILEYCKNEGIRHCCMFDDGITDLTDVNYPSDTISEVLNACFLTMLRDPMKDQVVGFSFHKRMGIYKDGRTCIWDDFKIPDEKYFLCFPAQAYILDVDRIFEHKIKYQTLDKVGFEDVAFFADCLKESLVFCSRKSIRIDGVVPNEVKAGGNHTTSESVEKKYDRQTKVCMKYLGDMMGISLEKRYRSYIGGCLTYIIWDTDFFREVLCDKPELNKKIIDAKFSTSVIYED